MVYASKIKIPQSVNFQGCLLQQCPSFASHDPAHAGYLVVQYISRRHAGMRVEYAVGVGERPLEYLIQILPQARGIPQRAVHPTRDQSCVPQDRFIRRLRAGMARCRICGCHARHATRSSLRIDTQHSLRGISPSTSCRLLIVLVRSDLSIRGSGESTGSCGRRTRTRIKIFRFGADIQKFRWQASGSFWHLLRMGSARS